MIARNDRLDSTPKTLRNEPIEKMLPNEPMEPIEKADPIDPMDMKDLWDAMDQVNSLGRGNAFWCSMRSGCHRSQRSAQRETH